MATGGNGDEGPEPEDPVELDNTIIRDFQNMRVLNSAFVNMGELVRDLSSALEESVKHKKKEEVKQTRQTKERKGKRKSKKRKSTLNRLSDSKESSLDEALKDYIESMTHQSDSDDWIHHGGKRLPALSTLSKQVVPQVESDSFTENFSPLQPLRRRRKFKRMAVDAVDLSPDTTNSLLTKNATVKLKTKVHLASSDNIMDEDRSRSPVTKPSTSSSDTLSGKRKRGVRCPGNSFEVDSNGDECFTKCVEREDKMDQDHKDSTSSLSSSECSEVRFTGDEGQEGDDEQSDFFFEPGPACGIPGIIPWWENEGAAGGAETDPRFEAILNGSIQHMSAAARTSFKHRLKQLTKPGREYRSARRFFKDRRPGYSLSRFLQDRQKWGDCGGGGGGGGKMLGAAWAGQCNGSSNGSSNGSIDTKRRRKTPPASPEEYVGQHADPIPESNIGNQILQNMGWTPGSGLGADGLGITAPILAYRKTSRKGLGATASTPS